MRTFTASEEEINVLAALIDMAVRHDGLRSAEAAVVWKHKLETAEKVEEEEPE